MLCICVCLYINVYKMIVCIPVSPVEFVMQSLFEVELLKKRIGATVAQTAEKVNAR